MSCVCSGVRCCLLCEPNKLSKENNFFIDLYFCADCGHKAFIEEFKDHQIHENMESLTLYKQYVLIEGVFLKPEVIDAKQETDLIRKIDSIEWTDSQSGRRKQDFGPKVNFKKQKLNFTQFSGLPDFDLQIFSQIRQELRDGLLNDFIAVEVCHLEYTSEKGSSIDPHFDDFWLWGPRLVTLNLLSTTVLNLISPPEGLSKDGADHRIRIVLPQRSLVILSSDSRYKYQHSIDSKDIDGRRIAVTFRELSPEFMPFGPLYEKWGKPVIERSFNALDFN